MKRTVQTVTGKLEDSNQRIESAEKGFMEKFHGVNEDVEAVKIKLSSELKSLKKRNDLTELADKAISAGDRKAFNNLAEICAAAKNNNREDYEARTEFYRVKSFYSNNNRIPEFNLELKDESGKSMVNEHIPTEYLIKCLIEDPDWRNRGRAAQLLALRKSKAVPSALIESIENDKNLDVLKNSMESFSKVSGYINHDVLDHAKPVEWWNGHKNKFK